MNNEEAMNEKFSYKEDAYLLENGNYFYIQTCETDYDYTLYKPDFTDLDGGQLDNPEISIKEARDEILKMHELSGQTLKEIPIADFEKMKEEASPSCTRIPFN